MAKNQLGTTFVTVQVEKRNFDAAMKQIVRQSVQANARVNRNLTFRSQLRGAGRLNILLKGAAGAAGAMAGSMAGFAGAAAGAASAIVGMKALGGIADMMRQLVEDGFRFNAQMERLNSLMNLFTGSATTAATVTQDLFDFASRTPLQLTEVSRAATMLLATNRVATNELLPTLRAIADAAAGSSEGFAAFTRVTRAVTQQMAKGRIMAEEMNRQLAEIGIPVWDILSEKVGIAEEQLRVMGERGQLMLPEIQQLLLGMGERFEGQAKVASREFMGLASTLRDVVARSLGEITKPLFEMSKVSLQNLVDWMDTPRAKAFIGTLKQGMQGVVDAFRDVDFKNDFLPVFEEMAGLFKDMAPIFKLMVNAFKEAVKLARPLIEVVRFIARMGPNLFANAVQGEGIMAEMGRGEARTRTMHGRTLSEEREQRLIREARLARQQREAGRAPEGVPLAGAVGRFQRLPTAQERSARQATMREGETLRRSMRTPLETFRESVSGAARLFKANAINLDTYNRAVAAARDEFMREGRELKTSLRTPLENFRADINKYREMLRSGAIDLDTFNRATRQSKETFEKETGITERRKERVSAREEIEKRRRPARTQFRERVDEIIKARQAGLSATDARAEFRDAFKEFREGLAPEDEDRQRAQLTFTSAADVNRSIQQSLRGSNEERTDRKTLVKASLQGNVLLNTVATELSTTRDVLNRVLGFGP